MGVLTIPFPGTVIPILPQLPPAARPESSPRRSAGAVRRPVPVAAAAPRPQSPAGTADLRDTLDPTPKGVLIAVEKTPEQIAEQQALARLVRRCLSGDAEAWQQLVSAQHRRVYGICYRFTNSGVDAEDLTQEVFLKLYRNLTSFDTDKGSFSTWVTTLTRNLLVDHFRRTRMDRATSSIHASATADEDGPTLADQLADGRPSQEKLAAGQELRQHIQAALKQISPELREAVILRDLEDMDYKEIAEVLRIPEGTVKSRISRGRGELARLLQRIEGQVI